ncbi:permease for cytosine/purines, uracil, thiamine, allantoin-domain-containing protein [Podospora conica]|nr:permease for cytosine/purines, uracil, thiamine, allantoin-domain-containing protein [Schizothecium conicum]
MAVEKEVTVIPPISPASSALLEENIIRKHQFGDGDGLYAKLQRFAGSHGIEQRGIERVPSDERSTSGMLPVALMWLTANLGVPTFALGVIAVPVYGLRFADAALVIVLVNLVSVLPVCFFSTLGPKFGLRQLVLSRFYFGWYGAKFVAILNILSSLGWATVNATVGAQLLHAVAPSIPGWASITIIALAVLLVSLLGYPAVIAYERWAGIPLIAYLVITITFLLPPTAFTPSPPPSVPPPAAGILAYTSTIFGASAGWALFAADYSVYQPACAPFRGVFAWTFAGVYLPLALPQLLGAAVATGVVSDAAVRAAYDAGGVGGVLSQTLVPRLGRGGAGVCLVVLAGSVVGNNCPVVYSAGLGCQVVGEWGRRVPRFVWAVVGTGVCLAVGIPGYEGFMGWLSGFLMVFSYWVAIYVAVAGVEHFVFRRGEGGYEVGGETDRGRLPPGWAMAGAVGFGVLGTVLGMAQSWWVGPVGRLCGGAEGGDVGIEMAMGFTAVVYVVLRRLEKSWFGR